MKLTTTHKWIIGGLLTAGIVGVTVYLKKQYNKIYNAVWTFAGAKIQTISLQKIKFTVFFRIKNEGDLSIIVSEQDYNVLVNDIFVSKVINKTDFIIASNATSKIPFDVDFKPIDAIKAGLGNLEQFLTDKSKIRITLKGKLTLKAGILKLRALPFEMTYTLKEIMEDNT
jgi:LEA14-like dessication related protein